jgi:hypothetical protein
VLHGVNTVTHSAPVTESENWNQSFPGTEARATVGADPRVRPHLGAHPGAPLPSLKPLSWDGLVNATVIRRRSTYYTVATIR